MLKDISKNVFKHKENMPDRILDVRGRHVEQEEA